MEEPTYKMPCKTCKHICKEFNARILSPKAFADWSIKMDYCIEERKEQTSPDTNMEFILQT